MARRVEIAEKRNTVHRFGFVDEHREIRANDVAAAALINVIGVSSASRQSVDFCASPL
jgi:hypothetical protein